MITDRLMREFLQAMPSEEISTRELGKRLNRTDSNVRRCLEVMKSLGMVEKIYILNGSRTKYVWKKIVEPK